MPNADPTPWFQNGLRFSCTMCGKCCTGEPGFVWVTDEELAKLAKFIGDPEHVFRTVYTRSTRGRRTLKEKANGDCVFYDREAGCTVYPVRPAQCRTWPFWESNLKSPKAWETTEAVCPGSGEGELIPVEEIIRRMKVIKM
jgi:Fe-S-cluster containining protein